MSIARRRSLAGQPRDYLASDDDTWPERDLVEDAPDAAHFAKKLALRPKAGCGSDDTPSIDAIAKRADINPQTISNLLNGKTWGEAPTIFQIEVALGYELWTHDHLPQSKTGHTVRDSQRKISGGTCVLRRSSWVLRPR